MPGRTLLDKIWEEHIVADLGGDCFLLHVDRHLLHDLGGPRGLKEIEERGYRVRNPEMTYATPDHTVSSAPGRDTSTTELSSRLVGSLRRRALKWGVRLFDINEEGQGIVHVIGPELGITLPGCLLVCGDSHTCTHGALGALAWGIGSSELTHVLATQTIRQHKPKRMRVSFNGSLQPAVEAKDLILFLIGKIGAAGGSGFAVEYAGSTVRTMHMEARMTLCNLSIELGAKIGMIAPDPSTFEYVAGRPLAPQEEMWEQALAYWRTLYSDEDARFDREVEIDATSVVPQVTWGTSPQDTIGIDEAIPDPASAPDGNRRRAMEQALEYMDLKPGALIEGTPIDRVFIGSCTNSRLSDLRAAAQVAKGRKVARGVVAWVVPGSQQVKREAEREGLERVFRQAGFEWREPGCSMCVAANGETVPAGERCVSTSNRNFVGRQGPGARTHLVGSTMAAAAAVRGEITDVRKLRVGTD